MKFYFAHIRDAEHNLESVGFLLEEEAQEWLDEMSLELLKNPLLNLEAWISVYEFEDEDENLDLDFGEDLNFDFDDDLLLLDEEMYI